MYFKINKSLILSYIIVVSKALSTKNIVPILEGIKFELTNEDLILTATNNDIVVSCTIPADKLDEINKTGSVVIPGRFLENIIKKTNDEIIEFQELTDNKINVRTKTFEIDINCYDKSIYPKLDLSLTKTPIILTKSELKNMINKTLFAVSNEETRPILTGINFKSENNIIKCSATDSHRLSKIKLEKKDIINMNIVLSKENIAELKNILQDKGNINLHLFDNKVIFEFDNYIYQSRLINGVYPNTDNLIKETYDSSAIVSKTDLYNGIDRISLMANKVKIILKENKLVLDTGYVEIGKAIEELTIKSTLKDEIAFYADCKYLLEALKTFEELDITICINKNNEPFILKTENSDSNIQLIVPILSHDL